MAKTIKFNLILDNYPVRNIEVKCYTNVVTVVANKI